MMVLSVDTGRKGNLSIDKSELKHIFCVTTVSQNAVQWKLYPEVKNTIFYNYMCAFVYLADAALRSVKCVCRIRMVS